MKIKDLRKKINNYNNTFKINKDITNQFKSIQVIIPIMFNLNSN
jgi:hypothetical protein